MKIIPLLPLVIFISISNFSFALRFPFGGNSAIIGENEMLLYKEPNTNSEVVKSLQIAWAVIVESNLILSNEKIQNWLFVDTLILRGTGDEHFKGWIRREDVAMIKDFKKLKRFGEYFIEGFSGDYDFSYRFYKNGTYKSPKFDDTGRKKGFVTGKVYNYKRIIATEDGEFFYFDYDNNFLSRVINVDTGEPFKATADKSKFPKWAR